MTSNVPLLQHMMHSKYFSMYFVNNLSFVLYFLHVIARFWYSLAMMAFISTGMYRIFRCDVLIHIMIGFTAHPSWMNSLCTAFTAGVSC